MFRLVLIGLVFFGLKTQAETVSGRVTDFDTQRPLAGVLVSAGSALSTRTDTLGNYRLDFDAAALFSQSFLRHRPNTTTRYPHLFIPFPSQSGSSDIRNLKGAWIPPAPPSSGLAAFAHRPSYPGAEPAAPPASGSLSKSAAIHQLSFELAGYMPAVRQISGSHDSLHISLKQGTLPSRLAQLTWYTSYPDPNSEECVVYNGCTWAGQFAALNGKQPESWVQAHNIAAVHEKDFPQYKLKTLRITQGSRQIDAVVYDMCSDSDCDGCCTQNAQPSGFLIDLESYTKARFGSGAGQVSWICLDCD